MGTTHLLKYHRPHGSNRSTPAKHHMKQYEYSYHQLILHGDIKT